MEVKTWAEVLAEAGEKKNKAEEEVGKAYYGVRISRG